MARNGRWLTHKKLDPAVRREGRRISVALRRFIFWRDNDTCRYCGRTPQPLYGYWSGAIRLHLDHVVPIYLGGQSSPENIVLACQPCNQKKGWKTLDEAKMRLLPVIEAT